MKKARVYCWKIFKPGLTDTPLKRFSYIEKEEDVLYYLPRQTSAHYGYELVSCLNCGEIYANDISAELYIEPRAKRLQKTNCIKCGENLGKTAKPYPDFYLGQDRKIHRSPEKFRYGDDAITHEFWNLYSNDEKEKVGLLSRLISKIFNKQKKSTISHDIALTQEVINRILSLPDKFQKLGNQTFDNLLKDSGYAEISGQIREDDILEAIKQHPEVVKSWFDWSENKRSSSGWFIKEDKEKYVVSFFPDTEGKEITETKDIYKACACFIKKEIESHIDHDARGIKLKSLTLKLFNENGILSKQNSVRVISDTENVILANQAISNVVQIIEKNFLFVYDFYTSRVGNNLSKIDALDIEVISIKIVLGYLYMYNMWRNTYKNKANLSLDFDKKDFSHPATADIIFYYFKKKYPNHWIEKSAVLLGMSESKTSRYYKGRELFYNK